MQSRRRSAVATHSERRRHRAPARLPLVVGVQRKKDTTTPDTADTTMNSSWWSGECTSTRKANSYTAGKRFVWMVITKKAAIIRKWMASVKSYERPFTALLAFCATDGSLLAPVVPVQGETWGDIEPRLKELLETMVHTRLAAGLSFEESVPCFLATDSFQKHRLKLRDLIRKVTEQLRLQPTGVTPLGPVSEVAVAASHEHPSDGLCLIVGEPYHRVISARRWVSPQCNDAVNFIFDHTDMLTRLSAERRPPSARSDPSAAPPILGPVGRRLLFKAVELSSAEFEAMRRKRRSSVQTPTVSWRSARSSIWRRASRCSQLFNRGRSVQPCQRQGQTMRRAANKSRCRELTVYRR